jgi:hypothetical protein
MNSTDTLGFKQNNPLNMRPLPNQLWHGQSGTANGFCVFTDVRWCFRAWLIEAHSYRSAWNCKTVFDYIEHYAPEGDGNDPVAYAAEVEIFMGLRPGEAFDLDARALDFCKGQMLVEIGGIPFIDDLIREGFSWSINR